MTSVCQKSCHLFVTDQKNSPDISTQPSSSRYSTTTAQCFVNVTKSPSMYLPNNFNHKIYRSDLLAKNFNCTGGRVGRRKAIFIHFTLCRSKVWIGMKVLRPDSTILGTRKLYWIFPIKQKFSTTAAFFYSKNV